MATVGAAGTVLTDAGREDPGAAVAACPGWTVSSLVAHVGVIHAWAVLLLGGSGERRPPLPEVPGGLGGDALGDWADEQRRALLAALAASDPDRPTWTFGELGPARFWWGRQAEETAVHAWDAANAVGRSWPIPGDVAVEGIEELLDWFLPLRWAREEPAWGAGRSLHLHRTDGEGEWLLAIASEATVIRTHAKGDLAVRGPAAELLLWMMNRPSAVELFGDKDLAASWERHVRM